uniref:Scm polycomb group protein like 2 n=1 Tax=Molossus molossus TaxID=27622 RepID=A0A7J8J9W9_MOLMO|nr:Scm polycomb group protein like 2 [Molossus molossus]
MKFISHSMAGVELLIIGANTIAGIFSQLGGVVWQEMYYNHQELVFPLQRPQQKGSLPIPKKPSSQCSLQRNLL